MSELSLPKKIWLVDDEESILEALSIILKEEGYNVRVMSHSKVLLSALKKDVPDLFLLDILIADIDGVQLTKFLKSNSKTKKIPIIIMSASLHVAEEAKKAGADDFIAKPFNIGTLLKVIRETLK